MGGRLEVKEFGKKREGVGMEYSYLQPLCEAKKGDLIHLSGFGERKESMESLGGRG